MQFSLTDNKSIQKVIDGCLKNDRASQKSLYKVLSPYVYPICMRYGSNQEEAADMMQEGFIKLFRNLGKYEFTGSFKGWCGRVFTNNCIDFIRKKPKLYIVSDENIKEDVSFDISALEKMKVEDLLSVIQTLPTGYRTVFNLFIIEGYGHKEIADILDISEGTSKSQLNRAKKIIQNKIQLLNKQENLRIANL